jgi:putative acetyltransferase
MLTIESVTSQSNPRLLAETKSLFRSYANFLRTEGGPELLVFSRLEDEITELPGVYTDRCGEILVAKEGSQLAGCIAYRSLAPLEPGCCEIKRLFVNPEFRGRGLGKRLIREALEKAQRNGYRTARLDTHPAIMPNARRMYLELGFSSDVNKNSKAENSLVEYFEKSL